ncbi:MAG TPA: ABC transporter ATP-binding protein [Candidatus Paceibacterota bacterium]|nr:ABC transporter ATP-binding protein [Candidatus Paceibacterota bacterium]
MQNIISIKNLTKTYSSGNIETHVLKGIDFEVKQGEFVAIMGRSGAGKSTLLYQMSLLDHPTGGAIVLDGKNTEKMSQDERTTFRLMELGYVFQDYALMPELTAIENVMIPLLMQGSPKARASKIAEDALTKVGLGDKLYNLPSQLSGGQQQRVSIARAIAHGPKIIFADEPTANLDSESSRLIIDIFRDLNERAGQTIIMVTHEEEYSKLAKRIVTLSDGLITSDISR